MEQRGSVRSPSTPQLHPSSSTSQLELDGSSTPQPQSHQVQQESIAAKIGRFISAGLDKIEAQSQNPDTVKLAQSIGPLGTAHMKGKGCSYQPDNQFRLEYSSMPTYPGVVVGVSWSQS